MLRRWIFRMFLLLAAGAPLVEGAPDLRAVRVYVGTNTSEGIFQLRLDLATGALSTEAAPTRADNPSWLDLHPRLPVLYAVSDPDFPGGPDGAVSAFRIDPETGGLSPMNQQSSEGEAPTYLSIDRAGRNLLVANFNDGRVAVLPLAEDGWLQAATSVRAQQGRGPLSPQQDSAHAHAIDLSADQRFALEPDLGVDKVVIFRFDAGRGELVPNDPDAAALAPGSGPRHLVFADEDRRVYVVNELSSTVTVFEFDRTLGSLTPLQTLSTLPEDFEGSNSAAEIAISADGRFVYTSNRGADTIAIFRVSSPSGVLTPVGQTSTRGATPRHFAIDPTGRFLLVANRNSDNIAVFAVDEASGELSPIGEPFRVPQPAHLRMVPVPGPAAPPRASEGQD